jgi:uncharacterized SAM-binding protein YcdF (DUF218 family)
MISSTLKELFVPGSYAFLLIVLAVGILLLYRKKDGGRAGRLWVTSVVLLYWILSTPIGAVGLVRALTPDHPPVRTRTEARGATAIVVLGSGMSTHRSRGDLFDAATREGSLRIVEAVRVYRLLERPWIIVTGGHGSERHTEATFMAEQLKSLGIPEERIVLEARSTNTHDHAIHVPPLLRERGIEQFVLVTSRQHIDRALKTFRAAGLEAIPSSPEVYETRAGLLDRFLPSTTALDVSELVFYDKLATIYYWFRGWL